MCISKTQQKDKHNTNKQASQHIQQHKQQTYKQHATTSKPTQTIIYTFQKTNKYNANEQLTHKHTITKQDQQQQTNHYTTRRPTTTKTKSNAT